MRLKGKVALITGAGSGIGRATAILFAKEGAKIVVADIDSSDGNGTVELIKDANGEAVFVQVDVSKAAGAEKMVKMAIENYGRLDILYNNAATICPTIETVTETTEEEWDNCMDVNLKGVFLGSKYAIPEMIKQSGGVIISTASDVAFFGLAKRGAYSASKAGVYNLTLTMALEFAPYNIRVNCVCPANIKTPMYDRFIADHKDPEKALRNITRKIPLGRLGKPEEIAYAALFLASDESSFVTGTALRVDGGITAGD